MKCWSLIAVITISTALAGCGGDVVDINADPQKYDGKEISLEGMVKSVSAIPPSAKMRGVSLYQVCDESGDGENDLIWVVRGEDSSISSSPIADRKITLKGVIRSEMEIRQKTYGPVIVERTAEQEGME